MPPSTQTRTIKINVDTGQSAAQLKVLADALGGVNKNTKSLADTFGFLKTAFGGFAALFGIHELVSFSDEMQNLNNRLVVLTGSQKGADYALQQLLLTANETKSSITDLGQTYARLATSLSNAHASTDQLISLTKVLQDTFRLSGANIQEANSAIVELSHSFTSGSIKGRELRSVLKENLVVSQLLRAEYGKDLFKKAEEGLITTGAFVQLLSKHFDELTAKAAVLTPTIEQSLTRALNSLKVEVGDLNKQFNISGGVATGIDILLDKFTLIGSVIGVLALTQIPLLVTGIQTLSVALYALAVENPVTATLLAIGLAVVLLNKNLGTTIAFVKTLEADLIDLDVALLKIEFRFDKFTYGLLSFADAGDVSLQKIADLGNHILDLKNKSADLRASPLLPEVDEKKAESGKEQLEKLAAALNKLYPAETKIPKIKEVLAQFNASFEAGVTTIDAYEDRIANFEVYKLNRQFTEGKIEADKFTEGLENIKRAQITRSFNEGRISLAEFDRTISESHIADLNTKLLAGKISLQEFNSQLAKVSDQFSAGSAFRSGTQDYITSIGTTSEQVAGAIKDTFSSLETNLTDFIKTGKFNFDKFTQDILTDIEKIIVRSAIVKPLAEGLLNFGATTNSGNGQLPASNSNYSATAAHGYAFDGGIKRFATGGIVSGPTSFGYGSGSRGLMGEAGPEAILPLTRGSGGNLGVQATVTPVTINVINQSGADVQTTEKSGPNGERLIELLVQNKVKEGLASGSFDKVMQTSYGLRRKGG